MSIFTKDSGRVKYFIYNLVATHFNKVADFPSVNEKGELPFHFAEHQLILSMDCHSTNPVTSFLLSIGVAISLSLKHFF